MKQQLWTLILFFILTKLARADDSIVMQVDSFQSVKQSIATARIADKYPITMGLIFDEIRCYDNVGFVMVGIFMTNISKKYRSSACITMAFSTCSNSRPNAMKP